MPAFRLTQDEAWDAISQATTGLYTTLRADGAPVTLPIWHVVVDRTIYVRTPPTARKTARARRDPRGFFLVETGSTWAELAAVTATVHATVLDDPDAGLLDRISTAVDAKYGGRGPTADQVGPAVLEHYADLQTIELALVGPLKSWNNRALVGDGSPITWG